METKSDDKVLSITDEVKEDPMINIKEEAKEENPKINVDADSKVIADNVVSDDEFFDDFLKIVMNKVLNLRAFLLYFGMF